MYWVHNQGGRFISEHPDRPVMAFNDRNPAWICGGIEKDGPNGKIIEWTQPEILLYDDDPLIRMSYPDRFNPYLRTVSGAEDLEIGKDIKGRVNKVSVYNRALNVSEAIGNYRRGLNNFQ